MRKYALTAENYLQTTMSMIYSCASDTDECIYHIKKNAFCFVVDKLNYCFRALLTFALAKINNIDQGVLCRLSKRLSVVNNMLYLTFKVTECSHFFSCNRTWATITQRTKCL